MKKVHTSFSTGLPELDRVLTGIMPGDNVVWQTDRIDDYRLFVHPFCRQARAREQDLVYFKFAQHPQLLSADINADVYQLHPEKGFEIFISEIFDVIEKKGTGVCYVFDCLSGLSVDWYSDSMLANFFRLTCPYLYDFETVAYFALRRGKNTDTTKKIISNTAQVVLDIYNYNSNIYLHPLKVYKRYAKTMYMLHCWQDNKFKPVTRSVTTSAILTHTPQPWLNFTPHRFDIWENTFIKARNYVNNKNNDKTIQHKQNEIFERLLRMFVTRDEKIFNLARKYFTLNDLLQIGQRMIGTGLIGGKAVGMLIARAVLKKNSKKWSCFLEEHDSFYIGSDVFYNFLIINGCWWIKRQLKDISQAYDRSYEIKERILSGKFPAHIENQFTAMLDYYGQSPIIVRSSSLLEDAYGNAFSGKYESVFCANQGTPEERLEDFIVAVLTVYASTMSKNALAYRSHWNLLEQEEQMAILVQRVSGEQYDDLFLPHLAGTGYSYNPFVWDKDIDPDAGFLRLVCGLGTRAVDYCDDDYTRIVSLSAPAKRPESNVNDLNKYSQHKIDLIDLEQNNKTVKYFTDLPFGGDNFPLELLSSYDKELKKIIKKYNKKNMPRVLTFDKLLKETGFVKCMHEIVQTLARAYQTHVDIEFTANFDKDNNFYINLLQCRPFQVKSAFDNITIPETIPDKDIVLKTTGPLIGHSRLLTLDSIIYVNPDVYSRLNMQDRYQVARVVGKAAHFAAQQGKQNIMLIGPGRWGTSSPELGVPVNFTEIKTVSVVCEFVYMRDDVTPDVSLGTHFFNDLVEMNILYLVIYPDSSSHFLNKSFLLNSKNRLADLVPDSIRYADSVRVIDLTKEDKKLSIYAQSKKQKAVCFYSTTETKEKL